MTVNIQIGSTWETAADMTLRIKPRAFAGSLRLIPATDLDWLGHWP
ncbi:MULTISPECIES: hypothetical protein [unclassified Pseudarthrobacter]